MTSRLHTFLGSIVPCLCAGAAMIVFAFVLARAIAAFHSSVDDWAARDLANETELAARQLGEHLDRGDFARIRAFGDAHRARGLRLTLIAPSGRPIYDSHVALLASQAQAPEVVAARHHAVGFARRLSASTHTNTLYCARNMGGTIVRFAVPYDGLIEPVRRAHTGLVLAGIAGACALLVVFLFTGRLAARARALAHERDEQARQLVELEQRERYRRDFVANVTHEIKTPLTGILTAADLLGADALAADDRATILGLLKKESHRLDALVHDVLDLARLEQDGEAQPTACEPVDVGTLLDDVISRLRPRADAARVALVRDLPATFVLSTNGELLEHALVNLVDNALKYSGSPEIVLSARSTGNGTCLLAVEDHGCGIPPEHRAHVFERFYRVDKDRSRAHGGTGLGLAIVKHIARRLGGDVALAPASPAGCRFTLALPIGRKPC